MKNASEIRNQFAMGWKILCLLVYWDLSHAPPSTPAFFKAINNNNNQNNQTTLDCLFCSEGNFHLHAVSRILEEN